MDVQADFAHALDLACGRMIKLGHKHQVMVELAFELHVLLLNDSFEQTPEIPCGKELSATMLDVVRNLQGRPRLDRTVELLASSLNRLLDGGP
jgi:hypothetical protein